MFIHALIFSGMLAAASNPAVDGVYFSTDESGRPVFSDSAAGAIGAPLDYAPRSQYQWHAPKTKIRASKPASRKAQRKGGQGRKRKKEKKYSLEQLSSKCKSALYRYHNHRGSANNLDWAQHKAKIAKYRERKEYWCTRLMRRR